MSTRLPGSATCSPIYERLFRVAPATAEILLFRISFGEKADNGSLRRRLDDVLSAKQS